MFIISIGLLMSGCVSKMIGGAVDVVTFGIVKNDVKETNNPHKKPLTKTNS